MKHLSSSPHTHRGHSTAQVMQHVMLACAPGVSALVFFFGWGVLFNLCWLALCALGFEALALRLRGRSLTQLHDCTALLTALLLAAALPATAPWWLGLIGIGFAILVGKQLFGGLGYNLFNPAMVGYAVLLVSFPRQMSSWPLPAGGGNPLPSLSESLRLFAGLEPLAGIDAYTGATLLDSFQQQRGAQLISEFLARSPAAGSFAARGWEWINMGFLLGGAWLLHKRLIEWRIPAAFLGALSLWALLFWDGGSSASEGSPLLHLGSGATMLGAFFIATDPVTASTTPRGRLIYGALIGSLVFIIRSWGSYPDGIAFAVLLGNLAVPLIDHYTRPRTFGHSP